MKWFHKKIHSLAGRLMPALPGRWQLAFIDRMLKLGGGVEPEAFQLANIGPCTGVAIDVGANYGLYSLALSKLYTDVIAFEPNRQVSSPLVNARLPHVKVIHEGLSSFQGNATLHTPVANGMLLAGWASLDEDNCAGATTVRSSSITVQTLDSHAIANVGFIKIDVEGHELHVLQGAETTIRRDKPHLLIEVRDKNRAEIQGLLTGWGYQERRLEELAGISGALGNLIFIPTSR